MKFKILAFAVVLIILAAPISIKPDYTSYDNIRAKYTIEVMPYSNDEVLLRWTTVNTSGIVGFEIERRTERDQFETLGFVPAGHAGAEQTYRFVDRPNIIGELVYRIKELHPGGSEYIYQKYTYQFDTKTNYPEVEISQLESGLTFNFSLSEKEKVAINLLNNTYEHLQTISEQVFTSGSHRINWDLNKKSRKKLTSGVYFLEFKTPTGRFLKEFVF